MRKCNLLKVNYEESIMAKVGVFICHCGINISSVIDVERVVSEISKIPGVALSTHYEYMCSDPGQNLIKESIKEHNLSGVVVAACTPRIHERTFQNCTEAGGLNRYFFEMVNIREQDSWVHEDKDLATKKAIDLVKMKVAKLKKDESLTPFSISVERRALVIGGGISGMQAALDIANAGHEAIIVEKSPTIGGRMAQLDKTFPTLDCSA
jgi:heterodisulfide reductase subunit A